MKIENVFFKQFSFTFFIKVIVSFGALSLSFIVGDFFGSSELGSFILFQATVYFIVVISIIGMNETLVLYIGREERKNKIKTYFKWALYTSTFNILTILMIFNIIVVCFSLDSEYKFLDDYLLYINISAPIFLFSFLIAGFYKGVGSSAKACLAENGAVSVICSIVLIINKVLFLDYMSLGESYFISIVIVFIFAVLGMSIDLKKIVLVGEYKEGDRTLGDFLNSSKYFFLMTLSPLFQTTIILFILGWYVTETEIAIFRVAQQISQILAFPLLVLNIILPRQFSKDFSIGNIKRIEYYSSLSSSILTIALLPIVILMIVFSSNILLLFNKEFIVGSTLLIILLIGQYINSSTGSVASILKVSGNEKILSFIIVLCNCISIVSFLILVPILGLVAGSIAISFILITQNLLSAYCVLLKLKIWPLINLNLNRSLNRCL